MSDMSPTAVIRRRNGGGKPVWLGAKRDAVPAHGFRSTCRMWAAETTYEPRQLARQALAQQLPHAVERAGQRGSQFTWCAAWTADWAGLCMTVKANAVVRPMRIAA